MSVKISGFQVGASLGIPQYGSIPTYYSIGLGQNYGGDGIIDLTYSAPINSTTLVFVGNDAGGSASAGIFANAGFTFADARYNGYGNYYEFAWINYMQNSSSVTNSTITSDDLSYGNFVTFAESLNGVSTPPSLSNVYDGQNSGTNTISVGFGINDGEIAVVCAGVEKNGGQITSVTGGGLTWVRKSSKSQTSSWESGKYQTVEVWYALNQTGSGLEDYVNITYESVFDDQATVVSTWSGVDLTNPWA